MLAAQLRNKLNKENVKPMKKILLSLIVAAAAFPALACNNADFKIDIIRWSWQKTPYGNKHMRGVAEATNSCATSAGVKVTFIALDKNQKPIEVHDHTWPFSVQNVSPGKHLFSLDHVFQYNPEIKSMAIQVTEVRTW
jgi:hypothetical protein